MRDGDGDGDGVMDEGDGPFPEIVVVFAFEGLLRRL